MGARELVVVLLAGILALAGKRGRAEPSSPDAELTLTIGGTAAIEAPADADLRVSRRGVVDLRALGKGRWEVTALRSGFVLIDAASGEAVEAMARWRVRVLPPDAGPKGPGRAKVAPFLPLWLCDEEGVTCDEESRALRGVTASHAVFLGAVRACEEAGDCFFALALSERGRETWRAELARLFPDFAFVVTEEGFVLGEASCTVPPRLPEALLPKDRLVFRCLPPQPAGAYELAIKVVLVEDGVAEALGFRSGAELALIAGRDVGGGAAKTAISAQLEALAEERRVDVIGEPLVRLPAGMETEIAVGGETGYPAPSRGISYQSGAAAKVGTAVAWKRHGLALKLTPTPLADGRVHLVFEASLRMRDGGAGAAPSLSLSSVRSAIDLEAEQPRVAAALDLSSATAQERETVGLARIPILGPLFRLAARSKNRTRVWLTFTLRPDARAHGIRPFTGPG